MDTATDGPQLQSFLADPDRPEGTLSFHEVQGFVFCQACCPDEVLPSEWIPEVCFSDAVGTFGAVGRTLHVAVEAEASMADSTPIRRENRVGRNDPCPCGSGRKFKKCCGASA